jgi:hypothetical protein
MEARSVEDFFERCNLLMMGKRPETILRRALNVLRDPRQWTRGARARDAQNRPVPPNHPSAVCWCIEGAVSMACNPYGVFPPYFMILLDRVARRHGAESAGLLNDHYRYEIVLQVLEEAIIECTAPEGGSHDTDEHTHCGGSRTP